MRSAHRSDGAQSAPYVASRASSSRQSAGSPPRRRLVRPPAARRRAKAGRRGSLHAPVPTSRARRARRSVPSAQQRLRTALGLAQEVTQLGAGGHGAGHAQFPRRAAAGAAAGAQQRQQPMRARRARDRERLRGLAVEEAQVALLAQRLAERAAVPAAELEGNALEHTETDAGYRRVHRIQRIIAGAGSSGRARRPARRMRQRSARTLQPSQQAKRLRSAPAAHRRPSPSREGPDDDERR